MAKADASITDKEMQGLSEQERAALEDDTEDKGAAAAGADDGDDADGDDPKAKDAAGSGDADDGDAGGDAGDAGDDKDDAGDAAKTATEIAAEAKAEAERKAAAEAAAAGKTADEVADDDDLVVPRSLRRSVVPVEKYDDQLQTLQTDMAEATRAFKAGELETEDYAAKQQEISEKRADLRALKRAEDDAIAFNRDADNHDWLTLVDVYMRHVAKADGINYSTDTVKVGTADVKLIDEFDRMVKALGNDPANVDKPGKWFLREADAIVRARYGVGKKADAPADKDAKPVKAEDRRPKDKIPKTLADAPAASDTETRDDEGEFAGLDKLNGMELEEAVARMTPAQQDRYARAS